MPLIRLSRVLGDEMGSEDKEVLQVMVCNHKGSNVGLVVDEIVDIVEEHAAVQRRESRDHIKGIAVVQEHVVEMLDVERIIADAHITLFEETSTY